MKLDFIKKNKNLKRLQHGQHIVAWWVICVLIWLASLTIFFIFFFYQRDHTILVIVRFKVGPGLNLADIIALTGALLLIYGALSQYAWVDAAPDRPRDPTRRSVRLTLFLFLILFTPIPPALGITLYNIKDICEKHTKRNCLWSLNSYFTGLAALGLDQPGSEFPPTAEQVRKLSNVRSAKKKYEVRNTSLMGYAVGTPVPLGMEYFSNHGLVPPTCEGEMSIDHSSYGYVRRWLIKDTYEHFTGKIPKKTIPLIWDKKGNHPEGRNVLFSDGTVKFMDEKKFQIMMEKSGIR